MNPQALDNMSYNQKNKLGLLTPEDIDLRKAEFEATAQTSGNTSTEANFNPDSADAGLIQEAQSFAEEHNLPWDQDIQKGLLARFYRKADGTNVATNLLYKTIEEYLRAPVKAATESAEEALDARETNKASLYKQMVLAASAGKQSLYRKLRAEYAQA